MTSHTNRTRFCVTCDRSRRTIAAPTRHIGDHVSRRGGGDSGTRRPHQFLHKLRDGDLPSNFPQFRPRPGKHSGTAEHSRFSVSSRSEPGTWVTHPDDAALHAAVLCCVPYPEFEKNVLQLIPDQPALDKLRAKIAEVVPGYHNGTWLNPEVLPLGRKFRVSEKGIFLFRSCCCLRSQSVVVSEKAGIFLFESRI